MIEIPDDIKRELEKIKESDIKTPEAMDEEEKMTKIGNVADDPEIKKLFAFASVTGKTLGGLMFLKDWDSPDNQSKQARLAIRQQNINAILQDRFCDKFHKDKNTSFYIGTGWNVFTE